MKKFLAILLIAIVACEAVEDFDLLGKITQEIQDALDMLKYRGIYNYIKEKLVTMGKYAAIAYCAPYLGSPVCKLAVRGLSILLFS